MKDEETCCNAEINQMLLENEDGNEEEPNGNAETPMGEEGSLDSMPLSKRQLKKQKKREQYETVKKLKKLREKERMKQKRKEALALGLPASNGPSRKQLKKRETQIKESMEKNRIIFDLNYDEEMTEADVSKCLKQLLRIYSINRRSSHPCQLIFTGIRSEGRVHNSLKRNDGWENWKVSYYFDKTHDEVFSKDDIIYLTCESDNVLESVDLNKVYVIGGLVDHNHHKGLCHERATQAGLTTARLPLSEYVDMKTRQVLSTYHVFEILLRVNEGTSWTDAILQTLPLRKGAKPKTPTQIDVSEV